MVQLYVPLCSDNTKIEVFQIENVMIRLWKLLKGGSRVPLPEVWRDLSPITSVNLGEGFQCIGLSTAKALIMNN